MRQAILNILRYLLVIVICTIISAFLSYSIYPFFKSEAGDHTTPVSSLAYAALFMLLTYTCYRLLYKLVLKKATYPATFRALFCFGAVLIIYYLFPYRSMRTLVLNALSLGVGAIIIPFLDDFLRSKLAQHIELDSL
jgi:CDP-diglyceride synthetase